LVKSTRDNGRGNHLGVVGNDDGPEGEPARVPHAYNDPNLPPMEFLLAVMHDSRTPMAARIDAAKAVSVYMHPRLAQVTQDVTTGVKIVIEGGLPNLPGTNIIMPPVTQKPTGPSVIPPVKPEPLD
jgi:hypothetical protein